MVSLEFALAFCHESGVGIAGSDTGGQGRYSKLLTSLCHGNRVDQRSGSGFPFGQRNRLACLRAVMRLLAHTLFDPALLAEGGLPEDPAGYVRRVNALLA
jgi:hypothetical protein